MSYLHSGFCRLFHLPRIPRFHSHSQAFGNLLSKRRTTVTSRLLPVWRLMPSVILLNVGRHFVYSFIMSITSSSLSSFKDNLEREAEMQHTFKTNLHHSNQFSEENISLKYDKSKLSALQIQRQETAFQKFYNRCFTNVMGNMCASLFTDVLFYPLETLVVRLCVQGTRTLVDNMDTGELVIPIISKYDGITDALAYASNSSHGLLSLYSGFGSLIAQYSLCAATLYGLRYLCDYLLYLHLPLLPCKEPTNSQER